MLQRYDKEIYQTRLFANIFQKTLKKDVKQNNILNYLILPNYFIKISNKVRNLIN
jgi:hypothetical protein